VRGSFEQIDETAWLDKNTQDKYFEYSDVFPTVFKAKNHKKSLEIIHVEERKPSRVSGALNVKEFEMITKIYV
jgi:hypothetical protein